MAMFNSYVKLPECKWLNSHKSFLSHHSCYWLLARHTGISHNKHMEWTIALIIVINKQPTNNRIHLQSSHYRYIVCKNILITIPRYYHNHHHLGLVKPPCLMGFPSNWTQKKSGFPSLNSTNKSYLDPCSAPKLELNSLLAIHTRWCPQDS